ncbi:P-loop containing nucleoside triphosphate hydrolase protein, partial [Mycena crocata]
MEHPANSLRDLDFVVPGDMTGPADIKLAFVYSNDIKDGGKIVDHLNGRVCPAYRDMGLIRPYNVGMSREYRAQVMAFFKAGVIRVLVCTDAAGMGCDIPNIEIVIQWKLPKNLSSWIQRAGRAARAAGTYGVAIMIVEKSSFEVNPLNTASLSSESQAAPAAGRRGGGVGRGGAKQGKDYAASHGQQRGWHRGGASDVITPLQELDVPQDAPLEGIYALIQATTCRRVILARIFKNKRPAVPKSRCCDICNPKLFHQARPSKPIRVVRQKGIRKGPP